MKIFYLILIVPGGAEAWEYTAGLPCRLTHDSAQVSVELTYDPTKPLYSISLTKTSTWPEADIFEMQFIGPRGLVIGTDRHQFSEGGTRLTVTDTGFNNVLDGLQFNHTARAVLDDVSIEVPLDGAADPVEAFRRCEVEAGV